MNSEIDELIHLMRQSRMDAVRDYLESKVKQRDKSNSTNAGVFLIEFREMFTETSTVKPK
jgi:hypothetical protein